MENNQNDGINNEIVVNKPNKNKMVLSISASIMALILAITIIVIAINAKKDPKSDELFAGIRLNITGVDDENISSGETETITRANDGVTEVTYTIKPSHAMDGVAFDITLSVKVDGAESTEEVEKTEDTVKFTLAPNKGNDGDATAEITYDIEASVVAKKEGYKNSDPVTWTHQLVVEPYSQPKLGSDDINNGVTADRRVYKDLDASGDWDVEEGEGANANKELGGGFYKLQNELSNATKIEITTGAFAENSLLKFAVHNSDAAGNWADGAYYYFVNRGGQTYVKVAGDKYYGKDVDKTMVFDENDDFDETMVTTIIDAIIADDAQVITDYVFETNKFVFNLTYNDDGTTAETKLLLNDQPILGSKNDANDENNLVNGKGTSLRSFWMSGISSDEYIKDDDTPSGFIQSFRLSRDYKDKTVA